MKKKTVAKSVRIPVHLYDNFVMLKEKGYIDETLTDLLLKGVDNKVREVLKKNFNELSGK